MNLGGCSNINLLATLLGCKTISLSIKHLGVSLGSKFKDIVSWRLVVELVERRLPSWKRKCLSKEGRLTLIKSTLFNIAIYYLSVLTIPAKVAEELEMLQCRFLRRDDENRRRFHLVNWKEVKRPQFGGGVWVWSLIEMNRALLGK